MRNMRKWNYSRTLLAFRENRSFYPEIVPFVLCFPLFSVSFILCFLLFSTFLFSLVTLFSVPFVICFPLFSVSFCSLLPFVL